MIQAISLNINFCIILGRPYSIGSNVFESLQCLVLVQIEIGEYNFLANSIC